VNVLIRTWHPFKRNIPAQRLANTNNIDNIADRKRKHHGGLKAIS